MLTAQGSGSNCIIIGSGASATADNCFVLGDEVSASENDSVVIGDTINGDAIPEEIAQFLRSHKAEVSWLVRAIAKAIRS